MSFVFIYLVALYSTSDIVFGSFLYRENKNLPFCSPFVNAATSILSLRLLDTHPLRAFIIKSIRSLIICISATMWGGAISAVDG